MILMNPLYNGWIRRHRRSGRETPKPAPWRANPPVSDELWARVEEVRRARTRGGGPKNRDRVDLLGGLLVCVCGRRLRNDGTFADGRHRKLHANPCEAWGRKARLGDETWEAPVLAQVARHRARRRHHRVGRRRPRLEPPAGRDRQGPDRAPDARARAGACRRQHGRRCLPRPAEGAPPAAGRDRGTDGRRTTCRARASSGSAPSASRSKPRRSRRRRQT